MDAIEAHKLLSHTTAQHTLDTALEHRISHIQSQSDHPTHSIAERLELLKQLTEFDFGRFMIQHRGMNGFWTHYMLTYPWVGKQTQRNNRGEPFSQLEQFMLDRAPTVLATQERFAIFLQQNQAAVTNEARLACIPSGMMGELLYLQLDHVSDIKLIGIDYDPATLQEARQLAAERKLTQSILVERADAWDLKMENAFNLISSNGLTIYEPDDEKVKALYRIFFQALHPGGKLVTSFLTPPPTSDGVCEWNFDVINSTDFLLQKTLFVDVLDMRFRCYRSTATVRSQLASLGFVDIQFIADRANLFPTVVAQKPL